MGKKTDISLVIMVVVILAVAVLGAFAVAPTVKDIMANKEAQQLSERLANGTASVGDLANSAGMKYDEYIAQYDVKADEVAEDTSMTDFMQKLTLKDYCTFMGLEYSDELLEAYKAQNEDAKDVTADTTDNDAKSAFAQYLYELQQAAQAETETPVAE